MSREQSQINLLRISRELNSVTQMDGNIWNQLQSKVTMIYKHILKDIHLCFFTMKQGFLRMYVYMGDKV